jgi:serine/threonine-protein kinase
MSVSREPTPELPNHPELNAVLQGCLAKDRNERFSSVGDFARALEPFAGDRVTAAALVARCVALVPKVRVAAPAPGAGSAAATATPLHGVPPLVAHAPPMVAPPHGAYQMTPPHGAPPMTTPPHGAYQMTPPHGAPPMTTPPHGAPPMATSPIIAPARKGRGAVIAIVLVVLVAGAIALVAVLGRG